MLNTGKFNRSQFNIQNSGVISASGIAILNLSVSGKSSIVHKARGSASINLTTNSQGTSVKYALGSASMSLAVSAISTAVKYDSGVAKIDLITSAVSNLFGESALKLEHIGLRTGDELIINTCEMTVLVRGQNGVRYLSADSEFFEFLNGENTVIYSDNASTRDVYIDVIWKDRYL